MPFSYIDTSYYYLINNFYYINMSTKFLGLNSINVIKDYIDKQILTINNNGFKNITANAYVYVKNGEIVPTISGGNFDPTIPAINYPEGWNSLDVVIANIKDEEGNHIDLETALLSGAIWMSVGMINAENALSSWSTPMKISGQNGQPGQDGAEFMFSYTIDGEYSSNILQLENTEGKNIIYFKYKPAGSEEWSEPGLWAKYTTDGEDGISGYTTLYRYGLSHIEDVDEEGNLIPPTQWVKSILNIGLSKQYPYLWMKSLSISANLVDSVSDSDFDAIEPILFSAWGLDGNVPNYTLTIYRQGENLESSPDSTPGIVKPEHPVLDEEDTSLESFLTLNDEWRILPDNDEVIWWQCQIHVNGQTGKVINGTEENPFVITRYNTLSKEAVPGQYTQILYKWSSTQQQPEFTDPEFNPFDPEFVYDAETGWKPAGWEEYPGENNGPESSLWMIIAQADGVNVEHNYPMLKTPWCQPIKITGPRGPIAYDYRIEYRYTKGTGDAPDDVNKVWESDPGNIQLTSKYPYLWARPYLVMYKMKYAADGESIEQINSTEPDSIIKTYSYYRLSGLNGEDGSTKNNLKYSDNAQETVTIKNFIENNMFIGNSNEDMTYNIDYSVIDFMSGYTGKFSNIGSGKITITTSDNYKFVNGNVETTAFELNSQESVEIICHKTDDKNMLLVVGKQLTE